MRTAEKTGRQTLIVYCACPLNLDGERPLPDTYVGVVQVKTNWNSVAGNIYQGCFDLLNVVSSQTKVRCGYSLTILIIDAGFNFIFYSLDYKNHGSCGQKVEPRPGGWQVTGDN